jgi:malic enzyme
VAIPTHPAILEAPRQDEPRLVHFRGKSLLERPLYNKDAAFTAHERDRFGLNGLLPPQVLTMEQQIALEIEHVRRKGDDLERFIGLAALQDRNETLFYRMLVEHLEELLPIVYTPTVGRACQEFSHIFRRARGIWLTPDDRERFPELLSNPGNPDVRLIVVTDNERILGLGDLGAGGMAIPVGKLTLYTAAAGIYPALTLPVSLDVGTDRRELLDDAMYLGWRGPRLRGDDYDEVIEAFILAVMDVFPHAIVQWEDFKQHNAIRLLDRYRRRLPTFNDDIQGTGAVALGAIRAALRVSGGSLSEQRVLLVGAGAAGVGIGRLLRADLRRTGIDDEQAAGAVALVDSHGLVHRAREGLDADKVALAMPEELVARLGLDPAGADLATVVRAYRPTILIGTTGRAGLFTEPVIRAMAEGTPRPIVMPLSNPTTNTEATPTDVLAWTDGRALVATGSPFSPVVLDGVEHCVTQANNVYIFPGVGLGAILSEARDITDDMFLVAADTLAAMAPVSSLAKGALFPPVSELRAVAREVAIAVVRQARDEGVGRLIREEDIAATVDAAMWWPEYVHYVPA